VKLFLVKNKVPPDSDRLGDRNWTHTYVASGVAWLTRGRLAVSPLRRSASASCGLAGTWASCYKCPR